ncbi:PLP-dependent aminotransferase family protein [Dactylosporangium sp. NPDC000521]|uniref:MocR-like pyridoxine biosynthesis transcription factor PdxR n=1 Tax=Dactylosporangium sp. NPDC000521 TaxID=3363975 RepID=UPI00367CE180
MAAEETNSAELLVDLDRAAGPLHRQLEAAIRTGIRTGRLAVGSALPPSRALAASLGVSRGVVVTAYEQLTAEGYLTSRSGGYTTIATGPVARWEPPSPVAEPARISFGYGRTDVSQFPRAAWLRSVRKVLTTAPTDRFGYTSGQGTPELRAALAEYLNRVRGTDARPDTVVICAGYAQAANLLIQVLRAAGATRLAVEDPSSEDDARALALARDMTVTGVPVGPDGVDVAALAGVHADALILTPSHQWPTGGVLPAAARTAVVRWASSRDALVIEDDYDAEYRYDRAAVGALQGLAPDRVAYVGSASKTLAPGLRLGWMILPQRLVGPVVEAKILADRGSPTIDQLTFADFLTCGEFDRHLGRMRPLYRRRRDTLLAALARHLPQLRPVGVAAGQHLLAWLPPHLSEPAVEAAARARGLAVFGVGRYRLTPGPPGLLFGYAHLTDRAIEEGITLLAAALSDLP